MVNWTHEDLNKLVNAIYLPYISGYVCTLGGEGGIVLYSL